MNRSNLLTAKVPEQLAGMRLDQVLAELFPDYSRSRLQSWIRSGRVRVDGGTLRPKDKVEGGEAIVLDAGPEAVVEDRAQAIPLDVVYEDDALLIVNKPAGLVVHPATGNPDGTLLNALLHRDPDLALLPRAGIVHRIDKETSGLLMIARTLEARHSLVEQLQARTVHREYLAIVQGRLTAGGTVDAPIGRHPADRKRHAVCENGKEAVTRYRVIKRFAHHTYIRLKLETGRTHQIRVHTAHIHHPLVGDPVYGGRMRLPAGASERLIARLHAFRRQALHAAKLGVIHPKTGDYREWETALPEDMRELLNTLEMET